MPEQMNAKLRIAPTIGIVLVFGLAACGQGSPTTEAPADGASGGNSLDAVYAELEGLEGEDWLQRLTELAVEEEGGLTWYTSTTSADSDPISEEFTDLYDIDVEVYRASAEDVLQRVLQETAANYSGTDVINASATQMQILDREGLLLPFETPSKDDIVEVAEFDTWAGLYLSVFAATWNTDLLSEYPQSWEQVLTDYNEPGQLAMELGDWDWFATLVKDHFMAEEGMTEDEAVELFRQAARNGVVVSGHTNMVQLMTAGEYAIATSAYVHSSDELREEGAPLAWEPAVEPLIARPNGIGIYRDTDRPASALLFAEYALGDAQEMLAEFGRTPANPKYGGVPEEYELITVDPDSLLDEHDEWADLYEEIVRLSGEPVSE